MVDVLLVLMLFFMAITSTEVLKKDKNLQLADAKNAKKDESPAKNQIVVNVGWDGINSVAQFSLDGVNFASAAAMESTLAGRHQSNPAAYVVIRADRDVQYSNVSELMNSCASAGISTVTFAVITGGGQDGKKPPGGSAIN